ncbi:MAG: hypothetical protein GKR89_09065 [Candidatus Latescibacteria bacterium]|nr:hypothetical protein [Candidatus Latescibacterota bacterium]
MSKQLPPQPSLEQFKKQAKDLLKAHRAATSAALARIKGHHPNFSSRTPEQIGAADFSLQEAQFVIAREYGFDSWPKLVQAVSEPSGPAISGGSFIEALDLIGQTPAMRQVQRCLEDLVSSVAPVLVLGEQGTGVERVAKAIHQGSARSAGSLVKINCGAEAGMAVDIELFGYVQGAFTGAVQDRPGRFEEAAGGTVFLDEIDKLTPKGQLLLLRLLEEGQSQRLGASEPIAVDVRLVAGARGNLQEAVDAGRFRADLFYRLGVMPIVLPALRQRREDIPLLVRHFVDQIGRAGAQTRLEIDPAVPETLARYDWPGNLRQLEAVLAHGCLRCREGVLALEHLPTDQLQAKGAA